MAKKIPPKPFGAWVICDGEGRPMSIHLNRAEARDMKAENEKVLRVVVSIK